MKSLRFFLRAGCSYAQGAVMAVCSAARFRDNVLTEVILLEKSTGIPVASLRAAHLRGIKTQLEEMLVIYDAQNTGAPKPH